MSNDVNKKQNLNKVRKVTSIIIVLAFFVLTITGVQMDLSHNGRGEVKHNARGQMSRSDALSSGPSVICQASFYPQKAHKWAGYLFIVAGCVHMVINIKALKSYVRI